MGDRPGLHVLLVQGDEAERKRCVTALAHCLPSGSSVEAVGSAEDALVQIKAYEYGLIIVDDRLPRLSGTDLLLFLRRYAPDALRVLMTTTNQASFIRRVQATSEPDLVMVYTGDLQRCCADLNGLLRAREVIEAASARGVSQSPPSANH